MYACSVAKLYPTLCDCVWTVARQTPLSMRFPGQENWSGLPFPPPGDHSDPGIELPSPVFPALAGKFFTTKSPGKPLAYKYTTHIKYIFTYG